MKKRFSLALLLTSIGMSLGLVSCKKDRTCTCTYSGGSGSIVYQNSTRKDAKKACDAYETLLKVDYADASCSLK